MKKISLFLFGIVMSTVVYAQSINDSIAQTWENILNLDEVVVIANKPVLKQELGRITYIVKNDPFIKGMNSIEVLDRIPRVSVRNGAVYVAGKSSVRYIIDGRLMEMEGNAISMQLKNLDSSGIEKIELLTTPPAKYATDTNVAFVSITTKNETFGVRGNVNGNTIVREKMSGGLGGSVSYTSRKWEMNLNTSYDNSKLYNDLDRIYTFNDGHVKTSNRRNDLRSNQIWTTATFKYKFSDMFAIGGIANYSNSRSRSDINDVTVDSDVRSLSKSHSPARPNNAVTLTAFSDWKLDNTGKLLSLTYNYFNKSTKPFSEVTSIADDLSQLLTNNAHNKYKVNSVKLDAILPFTAVNMEAGAAYTAISNGTGIKIRDFVEDKWVENMSQSNDFDYSEKTVALYVSANKRFSDALAMSAGLRYEHTELKGRQSVDNESHNNSYGYLIPSLSVHINTANSGSLSLSYSMGLSRPNFGDLNPFRYYTTTTDYYSGNPDLKPSLSHNAEISYSYKGFYAVLYENYAHNSIGYITKFNKDYSQNTIPENAVNKSKTGISVSFNKNLFPWWSFRIGSECFYSYAKSKISDFKDSNMKGWSGNVEVGSTFMLNRPKTLIFSLSYGRYSPERSGMEKFKALTLAGCTLRYLLLHDKLQLIASFNDPFCWNVSKSTIKFADYSLYKRNYVHPHSVMLRVQYSFGGSKVNSVWRDSKERESSRSY